MTNSEMSSTFDILWNNVSSNQAPGLNEAEKSVFLTKAQNMIVKENFNNRVDSVGAGFDGTQQRQYDFSSLIRVANLFNINTFKERITPTEKLDRRSKVYLFPNDYFLAVNEVISDNNRQYSVIPLSYDEYQRLMLKPYNFPVKRAAWRLITDKKNCNYVHTDSSLKEKKDPQISSTDYVIETSSNELSSLTIIAVGGVYNDSDLKDVLVNKLGLSDTSSVVKDISLIGGNFNIYAAYKIGGEGKYNVGILVNSQANDFATADDAEVMEALKGYFKNYDDAGIMKEVCDIVDGLQMCSASKQLQHFFKTEWNELVGTTFVTNSIQLPLVEIIGKFGENANYQLRYVKRPRPIILQDLTDFDDEFSIEGIKTETECELPAETHQEIVERAVTLAKIAWQGGTATQAAAASQQRDK